MKEWQVWSSDSAAQEPMHLPISTFLLTSAVFLFAICSNCGYAFICAGHVVYQLHCSEMSGLGVGEKMWGAPLGRANQCSQQVVFR